MLVTEVCFSRLLLGRQLVVIMSVRSIIHLSLKNCCFLSLHKSNQLNASTQRLDDQTTHQLRPLKKVGSNVFTGVTRPQWFNSKYRKVASRSTCYYSGNQVFGGATNRDMSLIETCFYSRLYGKLSNA